MMYVFFIVYGVFIVVFQETEIVNIVGTFIGSVFDYQDPRGFGYWLAEEWEKEIALIPAILVTYMMYGRTPDEYGL